MQSEIAQLPHSGCATVPGLCSHRAERVKIGAHRPVVGEATDPSSSLSTAPSATTKVMKFLRLFEIDFSMSSFSLI